MSIALKLALVQANPHVGAIQDNLYVFKRHLRDNLDADLIVFPESFLSGYPADDLVLNSGFMAAIAAALNEITALVREARGPAVLIGAPEPGAILPFNSAHLIEPDGSRRIVRKIDLPNSGPFDERRTFASGETRGPLMFRGVRLGIMICEEMWFGDVARRQGSELADVLLVMNGSPYTRGKRIGDRLAHARRRVRETGLPLIYLNMVGGQDELVFDGGSFALDAQGRAVAAAPCFETSTLRLTLTTDRRGGPPTVFPDSGPPDESPEITSDFERDDYAACVLGLRDYVAKSTFSRVVIGISGGIDSALAAAMAVDALGKHMVQGITLPSRFSTDIDDARAVATALGIPLAEIPIEDHVQSLLGGLEAGLGGLKNTVTVENLQARVRMIVLMAWSNDRGAMLVTTGNKSECSTGYSTLYGDMAGGFNPIKDLYKTDVWSLSRLRNRGKIAEWMMGPNGACIPEAVIAKQPTAGLAADQFDEDKLGPYAVLDALLKSIVDDQVAPEEAWRRVEAIAPASGWSPEIVERFVTVDHARFISKLVARAEYKRRQSAPGPKIGPRAFGRDRRYPIVSGWVG